MLKNQLDKQQHKGEILEERRKAYNINNGGVKVQVERKGGVDWKKE